jgi:hypothetical protein
VDWGIGWYSDHSPLKHNTSIHPVMGFEQLESSDHSDSQQQGSGNCWDTESLDVVGKIILVQLCVALTKTAAEQDETQVQLKL